MQQWARRFRDFNVRILPTLNPAQSPPLTGLVARAPCNKATGKGSRQVGVPYYSRAGVEMQHLNNPEHPSGGGSESYPEHPSGGGSESD